MGGIFWQETHIDWFWCGIENNCIETFSSDYLIAFCIDI